MVNEPGNCGRHLSLWKASWITRRPHWGDDSSASVLYFRKKINLMSDVKSACVCIAAVDRFELIINGLVVANGGGWKIPKEIYVTKFWRIGENIIAIKVENDDPLQGVNVLEAEVLPAQCLTSLIVQGEIQFENGKLEILSDDSWISSSSLCEKWDSCESDLENEAIRVDVTKISKPWGYNSDVKWLYAWERGTPPILPWGQIPLFGRIVEFPTNIEYRIHIPAGAVKVSYPEIRGSHSIILDGSIIDLKQWSNGSLKISNKDKIHEMIIKVDAENFASGLLSPVKIIMGNRTCDLHDWCEDGLQWFSGRMIYSKDFIMKDLDPNVHYSLNMNDVNFHAEVWLNGKLIETRIWKPYKVDISSFLVNGNNKLFIIVSNLAANRIRYNLVDEGKALAWNRYWNEENILRDSQNLVSGLLGPVKIEIKKRTI